MLLKPILPMLIKWYSQAMPEHINEEAQQESIKGAIDLFREFQQDLLQAQNLTIADIHAMRDRFMKAPFLQGGSTLRAEKLQGYVSEMFTEIEFRFTELQRLAGKTDEEAFEYVFGEPPLGEIHIIRTPICLYFQIADPQEYLRMVVKTLTDQYPFEEKANQILTDATLSSLSKTGGMALRSAPSSGKTHFNLRERVILLENSSLTKNSENTFIHEFQHSMFNLVTMAAGKNEEIFVDLEFGRLQTDLVKAEQGKLSEDELVATAVRYLQKEKLHFEYRSQDEILAYYAANSTWERIEKNIVGVSGKKPIYDDLTDLRNPHRYAMFRRRYDALTPQKSFSELSSAFLRDDLLRKARTEYLAVFKEFAARLEAAGYARNEIAILAAFYPMRAWKYLL